MTRYLEPSFSTLPPAGQSYRDNHDRIFGKKDEAAEPTSPGIYDPSKIYTYAEMHAWWELWNTRPSARECPTCGAVAVSDSP